MCLISLQCGSGHSWFRLATCYSIHRGATQNEANKVGRCLIAERSLRRCPQLLLAYYH